MDDNKIRLIIIGQRTGWTGKLKKVQTELEKERTAKVVFWDGDIEVVTGDMVL